MTDKNVQLLAHLVRRAGFGATREQLEVMADQGYEATVEKLLDTSNPSRMSDHIIRRYHPEQSGMIGPRASGETWLYRMTTTDTLLLEKIEFFNDDPHEESSHIEKLFWSPVSVVLDDAGQVYVTEGNRHRIQVFERAS